MSVNDIVLTRTDNFELCTCGTFPRLDYCDPPRFLFTPPDLYGRCKVLVWELRELLLEHNHRPAPGRERLLLHSHQSAHNKDLLARGAPCQPFQELQVLQRRRQAPQPTPGGAGELTG